MNEAANIWIREMGDEEPNEFIVHLIANNRTKALENIIKLRKTIEGNRQD